MKEEVIGVIPARLASQRLKRKLLLEIAQKPVIQWTWERAKKAKTLTQLVIATDSDEIESRAQSFGASVIKTGPCNSGTDRVAAAVSNFLEGIVINIQADEPLLEPQVIDSLAQMMQEDKSLVMATAAVEIKDEEKVRDENVVKVVLDRNNFALYFSRSLIPYPRYRQKAKFYKHLGIYAYRRKFLAEFVKLPPSSLEQAEGLEQLRALAAGYKIKVFLSPYDSLGLDTEKDWELLKSIMERKREDG